MFRARMPSCRGPPAVSSAWSRPQHSPVSTRSSASTWAAPRPMSRTIWRLRARLRHRSRRRPHPRADDAHPHGGGRRRLDPAFGGRPFPRRTRLGRRQSRPRLLSPRRPADGNRRQCHARQAATRTSFLRSSAPARTSRSTRRRAPSIRLALASDQPGKSAEEVAEGFITIAVENMANAIKKISVQRGYDVTGYALNCFGGAGGQHACLVADALGMNRSSFTRSPACCRRTASA
jgi:hypothetical protein